MNLRFWLLVMDLLAWCGLFGSRLYLWAVERASDATDWGYGTERSEGEEMAF